MNQVRIWKLVSYIAIFLCFGLLAVHLALPVPNPGLNSKKHQKEEVQLKAKTARALSDVTSARTEIRSYLWPGQADEIGPQAMTTFDNLAKQNNVTVQAFRPQKSVSIGDVTRYPYSIIVQGAYPKILMIFKSLRSPESKLALTSVQISASDGASDQVTATLGLSAFASDQGTTNGN